jgi:hypothetical protein
VRQHRSAVKDGIEPGALENLVHQPRIAQIARNFREPGVPTRIGHAIDAGHFIVLS